MRVLFQGDTHGDWGSVIRALARAQKERAELVIIVGDFGFGWKVVDGRCSFTDKVARAAAEYGIDVWWIDGNHENFDLLEAYGAYGVEDPVEVAPRVWYVPRGSLLPVGDSRVLFVGGAYSVDKPFRTPHVSWWPQEEITFEEANRALNYEPGEVDVAVVHDTCHTDFHAILSRDLEESAARHLIWKNDMAFPGAIPNRTTLEAVWERYRPPLWIHGHYHYGYRQDVSDTHFIGLDCNNEPGAIRVLDL